MNHAPKTQPISLEQLEQATDDNLIVHSGWLPSQREEMWVHNDGSLLIVDTLLDCDTFNVVSAARLKAEAVQEQVERVIRHFKGVQRSFAWWVGPADRPSHLKEVLREAGLEPKEGVDIAMTLDLKNLQETMCPPASFTIKRVRTPEQVQDFAHVVSQNWHPPDQELIRFYDLVLDPLLSAEAPLWLYVAYIDGLPVATSQLTLGGGIIGVYNVCTLEAYRRRGIASALVATSLWDAKESGYRHAILQASQEGFGIYSRIGFYETGSYTEYKLPKKS